MSISLLNTTLNKIHEWNEPEYHPLKRMFLTRICEVGCAAIEASVVVRKMAELTFTCFKKPSKHDLKSRVSEISRLIIGLSSTIFIGMLFSPEGNFKIHVKLHLAIDTLAEKNQKILTTKLQAELAKNEVNAIRDALFSKLEEIQRATNQEQTPLHIAHSRLVELLSNVKT
jgi:hypothetical protein